MYCQWPNTVKLVANLEGILFLWPMEMNYYSSITFKRSILDCWRDFTFKAKLFFSVLLTLLLKPKSKRSQCSIRAVVHCAESISLKRQQWKSWASRISARYFVAFGYSLLKATKLYFEKKDKCDLSLFVDVNLYSGNIQRALMKTLMIFESDFFW